MAVALAAARLMAEDVREVDHSCSSVMFCVVTSTGTSSERIILQVFLAVLDQCI